MYSRMQKEISCWWVSLIIGILMILFGIWSILTPWTTIIAFSYMFAFLFIFSGVSEILSTSFKSENWGWNLASGVFDLLIGILIFSMPLAQTITILAYFIGFWMMFRSVSAVGTSIYLQKQGIPGWGWLLVWSILGLILSFIFLMSPVIAKVFLVIVFGSSMISYGVFRIFLAFQLRGLSKI